MDFERKIAILVDADNVSKKYVKYILEELTNYGTPTYKRIYGDWTKPQMSSWKDVLLEHSISPIQQYGYTTGKNSTDSSLIIDAMDILYSGNVDGFCIVSSDSDFTRLASRLREAGMYVIGMGEKKTPRPFVVACEKFKYLETLSDEIVLSEKNPLNTSPDNDDIKQLTNAIRSIVDKISDDDGWAFMGDVGNILAKRYPDFDARNYGFTRLTPLVSSINQFEIDSRKTSNPHISHKFIRCKNKKNK